VNADELEARPADKPPVPPQGRNSAGLNWLALLLAAAALVLAGWMWWQGEQDRSQQQTAWQAQQQLYQDELARLEASLAAAQDSSTRQSSELSSDLQHRLQALEETQNAGEDFRSETSAFSRSAQAALEDSQARLNSLEENLRNLSARSGQSDTQLELEEIDYLLRMAQERLELFGDTRNADRALQLADQQIEAFDNPMFIALRREIAAARQALAAADVPDMIKLGAELDGLQDSLEQLPFRTGVVETASSEPVDAAATTEQPWWERLKATLSSLVTVRRVDDAELAMPVLADQLALRQRAWLQIEQARLAALSREQTLYQDSLAQAEATITRWFAGNDPQVKLAISGLQALQQRNVDPPMPDISAPWTTLRSLREAGLSPAPQAAEPAAEAGPEAATESSETTVVPAAESMEESAPDDQADADSDAVTDTDAEPAPGQAETGPRQAKIG
jgi:uroporphyrin-3 C-methyltransferase